MKLLKPKESHSEGNSKKHISPCDIRPYPKLMVEETTSEQKQDYLRMLTESAERKLAENIAEQKVLKKSVQVEKAAEKEQKAIFWKQKFLV